MNNYYAELNLNKDDSLESIRDSLFKEKKKWANRANKQADAHKCTLLFYFLPHKTLPFFVLPLK